MNASDQLIQKYIAELCKKLQKKIEFNLGQRFGLLDCEENIESVIQLLKANNLYDIAITSDLPSNKKQLRRVVLAVVGGRGDQPP